jgi:hypothetical protein
MSEIMSPLEICGLTTVSERHQYRIMKGWRQTGDVHKLALQLIFENEVGQGYSQQMKPL